MIKIGSLVNSEVVWVPYPAIEDESFKIGLKFLSKEKALKMQKSSTKKVWDKRTHQPYEEQDDEKFMKSFIEQCVEGWEGLTFEKLTHMVPVDLSQLSEEQLDEGIEFSPEQMTDLIDNDVTGFADWLIAQTRNIENFTKSR